MSIGGINSAPLPAYQSAPVTGGGFVPNGLPQTAGLAARSAGSIANYHTPNPYSPGAQFAPFEAGVQLVPDTQFAPGTEFAPSAQFAGDASFPESTGPAAWDDAWAQRFADAGAGPEIIQELQFSGGMGLDAAALEKILADVTEEVDGILAEFEQTHPKEYKQLTEAKDVDRALIAQIALGVAAGEISEDELKAQAEMAGTDLKRMMRDSFFGDMLPFALIPGWGAVRVGIAPFFGGKDPLRSKHVAGENGQQIRADFWNQGLDGYFNAALLAGGVMPLVNNAQGIGHMRAGRAAIAAGGDAATIAAREGVAKLTGRQLVAAHLPWTRTHQVLSGLGRLNEFEQGVKTLEKIAPKSTETKLARSVLRQWKSGQISVLGDGASKWSKMGLFTNTRGILPGVGMRGKELAQSKMVNGVPTVMLDVRARGNSLIAHMASSGVDVGNNTAKRALLADVGITNNGALSNSTSKALRERVLATTGQKLEQAGVIARPQGGKASVLAKLRPGATEDVFKAVDRLAAGKIGTPSGAMSKLTARFSQMPKGGRLGVLAGGAAALTGAGYLAVKKFAGGGGAEETTPKPVQNNGGMEQLAAEFKLLSPEDQQAIIQEQATLIQQAAQQPNLTAEDEAIIDEAVAELQVLIEIAN